MKREDQIKLLETAQERAKERNKAFATDPKMKQALHEYDYLYDRHKPKVMNA